MSTSHHPDEARAHELCRRAEELLDDAESKEDEGATDVAYRSRTQALQAALEALTISPTAMVYALSAQAAFAVGDLKRANGLIRDALACDDGERFSILTNAGFYALTDDRPQDALAFFERAIARFIVSSEDRDDIHITLHNMGLAYEHLGDLHRALDYTERSLEACPEYVFAQQNTQRLRDKIAQQNPPQ